MMAVMVPLQLLAVLLLVAPLAHFTGVRPSAACLLDEGDVAACCFRRMRRLAAADNGAAGDDIR